MRLLLHIGTEKTGSTAIQAQLEAGREAMLEQGVFLPESLGERNHRSLSVAFMRPEQQDDYTRHHALIDEEERNRWREELLEGLSAEIEAARQEAELCVISTEHFHSRLTTVAQTRALAAWLREHFSAVEVVCYLRRQDEMATSFYSQKLRAGNVPHGLLPLERVQSAPHQLPAYFDFDALLDRWADAFGETAITPVLYRQTLKVPGGVIGDFFQRLGVERPDSETALRQNRRLGAAAQRTLLAFNIANGRSAEDRDRARPLRRLLVQFLEEEAEGAELKPTRSEAEAFYAYFRDSNARMARRWFPGAVAFDECFDVYPEAPDAIDDEAILRLQTGFLAWLARDERLRAALS